MDYGLDEWMGRRLRWGRPNYSWFVDHVQTDPMRMRRQSEEQCKEGRRAIFVDVVHID